MKALGAQLAGCGCAGVCEQHVEPTPGVYKCLVSVCNLKPGLRLFNMSILAAEDNDTQLANNLKKNILTYLNEKYSVPIMDDLLDITFHLDPQFKKTYIENKKVEHIVSVDETKSLQDHKIKMTVWLSFPKICNVRDVAYLSVHM